MTPQEEFVKADDGVRLFVQSLGTGRELVIIPNRVYLIEAFVHLAWQRTVIFCDPRNRGRSDHISDRTKMERGIHHDIADFDAIRRHFGRDRVSLIGHSYMGLVAALYAMKYPRHVESIVQIGPMPPDPSKEYPAHLTNSDATFTSVLTRLGELQKERASLDAIEYCRRFWSALRPLYVLDPADADRLGWEPCYLPNELTFMKPWNEFVLPSIQQLRLTPEDFAATGAPVLVIHGRHDRSSPYGGGRDWALRLPNARLITIDRAAHVPWIEEPELVFGAIETFLDGMWPDSAERVTVLDKPA